MKAGRKCISCGRAFSPAYDDQVKCPDCAEQSKKSVMRDRTCRECGITFPGGPRAWYCPECRAERKKQAKQRYQSKGPARPIGSIDRCEVCGKEYTVNSARQRYCPDCAAAAVKAADNAQGREYMQEYRKIRQRRAARLCVVCGKPLLSLKSIYCSAECKQKAEKSLDVPGKNN